EAKYADGARQFVEAILAGDKTPQDVERGAERLAGLRDAIADSLDRVKPLDGRITLSEFETDTPDPFPDLQLLVRFDLFDRRSDEFDRLAAAQHAIANRFAGTQHGGARNVVAAVDDPASGFGDDVSSLEARSSSRQPGRDGDDGHFLRLRDAERHAHRSEHSDSKSEVGKWPTERDDKTLEGTKLHKGFANRPLHH